MKNMGITEIRKSLKKRIQFDEVACGGYLAPYFQEILDTINELWKEGYIRNFSDDILRLLNGYQINTGDYDGCHILQTLDLRSVEMTKTSVKAFGTYICE